MDPLTDHASQLPAWAVVVVSALSVIGLIINGLIAARASRGVQRTETLVEETHHQVTVNHHSSESPTVLDRIDDLRREIADVRSDVAEVRGDLAEHKAESGVVVQLLTGAVSQLANPSRSGQ